MEVGVSVYAWPGNVKRRQKGVCALVTDLDQFDATGKIMHGNVERTGRGEIEHRVVLAQEGQHPEGLMPEHQGQQVECIADGSPWYGGLLATA